MTNKPEDTTDKVMSILEDAGYAADLLTHMV